MLFTDRSILTMVHGIGFGGAALMGLAAALFYLSAARSLNRPVGPPASSRALALLIVATAMMLWLTVLGGTYLVFPLYRATPPAGVVDFSQFPRALVMASPDTAWLHAFAMESKEHMSWIAAMLTTAVAFVAMGHRSRLLHDPSFRRLGVTLLVISLGLVAFVSLMGVFVNKVAPLQ